ncbi:hypothetical protein [Intrasporangium calvum]|uniref:Uncharacterized protein n=1 Tax=Intrasporangium calvum (strain ATCC 23552 / DSM 43043 / JCM 3097 / NBRC 12989 / NCIMB 10167 / NRRL B-3866 / 7 KIP) TaxID=710696 RepID=E6S7L1_INTC7|nr:hypothetical protein [Intrasporangium calvum]ADU46906.1 hypothetical protein Intca_0357 [Intrasporangium calvum DSM 43043]
MPDNMQTILWIVLALVVVALVIWLLVSSSRRRKLEARQRADAAALRARAEEQRSRVQVVEDRASVVGAIADDARAEAEAKAAEAARLERQAEHERAAAEAARHERETLVREADRLDPDVRTDDEGYRVDRSGHRLEGDGQRAEERGAFGRPGGAPGSVAAGVALGSAGAAAAPTDRPGGPRPFTEEEDEPDLADAENPFAGRDDSESRAEHVADAAVQLAADERAPETADPDWVNSPVEDIDDDELAASAAEETAAEDWINGPEQTSGGAPPYTSEGAPAVEVDEAGAVAPGAAAGTGPASTTDAREDEAMTNEDADWVNGPVEDVDQEEIDASAAAETDAADWINGPSDDEAVTSHGGSPQDAGSAAFEEQLAADPMTVDHVDVPALDDRDDVVVGGGTPSDDPGDHRGQPWSTDLTTPGGAGSTSAATSGAAQEPAAPAGHGEEQEQASRAEVRWNDEQEPDAAGEDGAEAHAARNPGPIEHSGDAPLLDDAAGTDEGDEATSESSESSESELEAEAEAVAERSQPPFGRDERLDVEPAAEPAGSEVPPLDDSGLLDQDETPAAPPQERRISNFDEVRDGGFGIGSAAPLDDRAQPLGHAVKGYRDSNTFLAPGASGYEDREPDVWFFNEEAARRAGFNPTSE